MKNTIGKRRFSRVLALGMRLMDGKRLTRQDICEEYEINERTFFRDIQALRDVMTVQFVDGVYSR